ncbi:MAG TPA: hypothetical protein DCY05_09815 [Spirochaetaceae bacterium]|nr:hypothetical protein [Spirochaetaceae bacterium]
MTDQLSDLISGLGRKAMKKPGRSLLQLAVVAAGALAFAPSLSLAGSLTSLAATTYRNRLAVGTGSVDESGDFAWSLNIDLTRQLVEALPTEVSFIKRAAVVNQARWNTVRSGDDRFRIRSVVAASADYPAIMGLVAVAGTFFDQSAVDAASPVVAISSTVAREIFGSVDAAIGQALDVESGIGARPGSPVGNSAGGLARAGAASAALRLTTVRFTVAAVYQAPATIARNALGLPDALIPWTAEGSAQRRAPPVRTFVVETDGAASARAAAAIRQYLVGLGQTDPEIGAWEGSPFDPEADGAGEARRMLNALSATLVSLGALVLLVSVLGVYTWTSMEAADSAKQTAIRRALGESAAGSVKRFVASIATFGAVAGLVGALVSLPAYRLLSESAEAILIANGTADSGLFPVLPPAWTPALAVLVTVGVCALFALPPALSAGRQTITSGIQEL